MCRIVSISCLILPIGCRGVKVGESAGDAVAKMTSPPRVRREDGCNRRNDAAFAGNDGLGDELLRGMTMAFISAIPHQALFGHSWIEETLRWRQIGRRSRIRLLEVYYEPG